MMKSIAYRTAIATGYIAGVFALFIAINLTVNHLRLKSADPLDSAALQELRSELREQPENESLKTEIRNLDLLARKAYFNSLTFTNAGAWLLLGSLAIMLIALKIAGNIAKRPPQPDKFEDKDTSLQYASQAREALLATLVIMVVVVAFTLLIAENPLGFSIKDAAKTAPDKEGQLDELHAEMHLNWPSFRGHNGIGIAHYTNAPTAWDGQTGENVLWKKPVPRRGFSSPIVWEDKVFLTCADETAREVLCYDGASGELLWQEAVGTVPGMPAELPEVEDDTTYAASTPATDGRYVFAIFGTGNVACFDFEGNRQWVRHLVDVENIYGHSSSLTTYRDMLFVQFDDDTKGRVFALDAATGETRWRDDRDLLPCWSSPIIAEAQSGPQLVVAGNPKVMGYELEAGERLWEEDCLDGEVASSPAFADNTVFTANEYANLTAIKLGDPIEVIWDASDALPDVSSPVASDEHLIVATGYGTTVCYNPESGEKYWTEEFDEGFYSSPILVGNRVYLMDRTGTMHIFKADDEYREIAQCELGEPASSIPAIMDGKIYIRGQENLYCIAAE